MIDEVTLGTAITFLWDKYNEKLTVPDIANTVAYSRFYFAREFARLVGCPPSRYLAAIRIYEAQRKLQTTVVSTYDIACLVGYDSPGTFVSMFKSRVGVSASQFRQLSNDGEIQSVPDWPDRTSLAVPLFRVEQSGGHYRLAFVGTWK